MPLWQYLLAAGTGILNAPEGASWGQALGSGLNNIIDAQQLYKREQREARRDEIVEEELQLRHDEMTRKLNEDKTARENYQRLLDRIGRKETMTLPEGGPHGLPVVSERSGAAALGLPEFTDNELAIYALIDPKLGPAALLSRGQEAREAKQRARELQEDMDRWLKQFRADEAYRRSQLGQGAEANRLLREQWERERDKPTLPFEGTSMEAQDTNMLLRGDPSSPEYAASYARMAQPKVSVGADGSVVTVRPDMSPYSVPTYRAGSAPPTTESDTITITPPTKMTSSQGVVATYTDRMIGANEKLNALEPVMTSAIEKLVDAIPVAGNWFVSSEYQQAEQAKRDFVNAVLRRESGAVISPSEFENADKQYFPQPGDKPEVIAQKRRNRQTVIQGFVREAGEAYSPQYKPRNVPRLGEVQEGYKFLGGDPSLSKNWEKVE
jgi:DNA-binding XRE family transcriptional regulator